MPFDILVVDDGSADDSVVVAQGYGALPKRPAAWKFRTLGTLRHRIIQRAGCLTRPQGELTLTMSANRAVRKDLWHFLDADQKAV